MTAEILSGPVQNKLEVINTRLMDLSSQKALAIRGAQETQTKQTEEIISLEEQLQRQRDEGLRDILEMTGKTVCTDTNFGIRSYYNLSSNHEHSCGTHNCTETSHPECFERRLGIFPKEETKALYKGHYRLGYSPSDLYQVIGQGLYSICQKHYPKNPNTVTRESNRVIITSEVVEVSNRLIALVNFTDVTDAPRFLGQTIAHTYRYFGLPILNNDKYHEFDTGRSVSKFPTID